MNRSVRTRGAVVGIAIALVGVAGCATNSPSPDTTNSSGATQYADLTGELKASGATFPNNFYQAAIDQFETLAPDLVITYNAVGSGTGKKEFGANLVDFAGSDSLVKDGDGPAAGSFSYVPTVAAPITVSYHLDGVTSLKLGPDTLAKIFQRDIKTWNDPAITADNGSALPDKPITVVHRSDGSGTTNNFTKYLAAASPAWKLAAGDTVQWPADTQGAEKNGGVAQLIAQTDGAIGYVDFADATAANLTFASIKNKDGQYVAASLAGATAALAGAEVAADLSYNPLNAAGADTYPITAATYLLVRTSYDAAKGKLVKGFITWLLTDGQALAQANGFAKLPAALQQKALDQLAAVGVG